MAADPQALYATIVDSLRESLAQCHPAPRQLIVGLSGGVDSALLLTALTSADGLPPVQAVYIHHGLQAAADDWQNHCNQMCTRLGVPFTAHAITVSKASRQSLEANARDARYRCLLDICQQHQGALVLGQHQDDQLETFLLQAKRGSGPAGLAAMAPLQYRDQTPVLRPMLGQSRADIEAVARSAGISWVEDCSNQDERHERNFLRHSIIPLLKKRWPAMAKTVSRSARLCAEQQALIDETTRDHLAYVSTGKALSVSRLAALSPAWQRQVLRSWCQQCGGPLPSSQRLAQIEQMLSARPDRQPQVTLGEASVRRAFDYLYWVAPLVEPPFDAEPVKAGVRVSSDWVICSFTANMPVVMRGNMPAITVRTDSQGVSKKLKDWLRQWQVPAWQRSQCPVLFIDEQPVAVVLADEVKYFSTAPACFSVVLHHPAR